MKAHGFTLIELVIALVVIGLAAGALYGALGAIAGHSADPMLAEQANAIARAYMEEITAKPFVDPSLAATAPACAGPVEVRAQMNNICDYNGLADIGAHDQSGQAIPALSAYEIKVSVTPNYAWQGLPPADVLRIDITVIAQATGLQTVTTAIRTRY